MVLDNTAAQGWDNRCSVSSSSSICPIIWELSLFTCQWHLYASIGLVWGEENKMTDTESHLTQLSDRHFLRYFKLTSPHQNPCRKPPFYPRAGGSWLPCCTTSAHSTFFSTIYQKSSTAWHQWCKFCSWMHMPTNQHGITDNITFLQIFVERVHAGILAEARGPINKRSMDQYIWLIVQIFLAVGADNPRWKR